MFYLIEQSYVGSDPDYLDSRIYRVQTVPGKSTNSGTVNDWTHCARGEYSSLEEAQAEIFRLTQDYYRECEAVPDSRETRQEVYRVRAWLKEYQSLPTDSSSSRSNDIIENIWFPGSILITFFFIGILFWIFDGLPEGTAGGILFFLIWLGSLYLLTRDCGFLRAIPSLLVTGVIFTWMFDIPEGRTGAILFYLVWAGSFYLMKYITSRFSGHSTDGGQQARDGRRLRRQRGTRRE